MKLHFNSIIKCAAAIFCGASLFACNDLSELEERVDSLDSRITALETQLPALQDNIDAVQALLGGQIFITEISTNDSGDEYTLKMSDGNSYTIKQGKIGNTPQISVEDGYWIVSYDNGGTFSQVKVNGENVPVTAAPLFRVNADGNWEISTDGKNYETVSDTEGNPVPAVGEGGNFFQNIEYNEESGELSLTLADGKTYSFTVSTDFVCSIVSENNPEPFSPGQTRVFDVKMRGVKDVYLTKPAGWSASLEGEDASDPSTEIIAKLTVTAPETEIETKISADTDTDLVLHAFSGADDRSIYSKIAVAIVIVTEPEVSVSAADITDASITYTITPNDLVTSWKYIHQLSSEEAPTAESTAWTEGTGTTLTIGELEAETAYTLYVLPVGADGNGQIVSTEATTEATPIDNYYEAFMAGQDIKICGTIYNKSQFAEDKIIHCTGSVKFSSSNNGQILFVAPDCVIEELGNMTDVIIIGDSPTQKPVITINASRYLVPASGQQSRLVLKNLVIVPGATFSNYMFTVNQNYATHGAFGEFTLENCDITMTTNPFYSISNARYLDKFRMENCRVKIPADSGNRFIIQTSANENTFSEIVFRNNIFYCESGITLAFRMLSGATNTDNKTTVKKITVENNTIINAAPTNSSLIISASIEEATVKNNLLFYNQTISAGGNSLSMIFGTAADNAGYPTTANCVDNFVYYGTNEKGMNMFYSGGYQPTNGEAENPEIITDDPFSGGTFDLSTGTFIPNSTYSSYGSTIGR